MVRAAASGAIDFSQADPFEPRWWVKLEWILQEIARQNNERQLEAVQRDWLAYVGRSDLKADSYEAIQRGAQSVLHDLVKLRYPWRPANENRTQLESVSQMWADLWGDPRDPKWQDPASYYWPTEE